MPGALVFEMSSTEALRLNAGHGSAIHGMFYDLMHKLDPNLADRIHAGDAQREFTLSPLCNYGSWRPAGQARAGDRLQWRCTLVSEELIGRLRNAWLLPDGGHDLELGKNTLRVERLLMTPTDSHGWARLETLQELVGRCRAEKRIAMEFVTPTTFRQGDVDLPLPVPGLVFGSLWKRASAFYPAWFQPLDGEALTEAVTRQVKVARHQIRSERAIETGFTGTVQFEAGWGVPEDLVLLLNLLAELAFYLGVGRKTTMGMGMARRVPDRERRDRSHEERSRPEGHWKANVQGTSQRDGQPEGERSERTRGA